MTPERGNLILGAILIAVVVILAYSALYMIDNNIPLFTVRYGFNKTDVMNYMIRNNCTSLFIGTGAYWEGKLQCGYNDCLVDSYCKYNFKDLSS